MAQRMAGSQEFKGGMAEAKRGRRPGRQRGEGPGGRSERGGRSREGREGSAATGAINSGSINSGAQNTGQRPTSTMFGADAWAKQADRENLTFKPQDVGGNTGSTINSIIEYGTASNSANQASRGFGNAVTNNYTNAARASSAVNKENNKGFSDNRITNNTVFANQQQDLAARKNEGFSMNLTNNQVNNAKGHREHNTSIATQFANQNVKKYLEANKANQSVDIGALDRTIRQAPIINQSQSQVQGGYTYGDMYSYGRNNLPNYQMPETPSKIEGPDFDSIYDKVTGDINDQKIKT